MKCEGCFMYKHNCEVHSVYEIEADCPCNECLIKTMCTDSCDTWKEYVRKHLMVQYRDRYGDNLALQGHVENMIQRLNMMRYMAEAIDVTACAFIK